MRFIKNFVIAAFQRAGYTVRRTKVFAAVQVEVPEILPWQQEVLEKVSTITMTNSVRRWAFLQSLMHVHASGIAGDIVECGVWKGGNLVLAMLAMDRLGDSRTVWAYDTFAGMSAPTKFDSVTGDWRTAERQFENKQREDHNEWCYAPLEEVRANIESFGLSAGRYRAVKGKCEDTLRVAGNLPERIAVLRLDTDFYESTAAELEILYPRLASGGVLIIDDYGAWTGSRKAVDAYFAGQSVFLHRVDEACRLMIKP